MLGALLIAAGSAAAAARPGTPVDGGYADAVEGEGPLAIGTIALGDLANDGAGVRIAILDMGFGTEIAKGQRRKDLPPASRLTMQSFDATGGLTGANAYGAPTDHGDLVAQSVYDFAPRASYLFVNYHSVDEFIAATDWLAAQRVDIVVHANNFLDGPFDGTSPAAQAVDRAAAAGVMWFNSAGNYGQKAWHGSWRDGGGDRVLDWPEPWTIARTGDGAVTFHLNWTNPAGALPTDLELIVDRQAPDGSWTEALRSTERATSSGHQVARIVGARPGAGTYRLRVRLVSGPPPAGGVVLYSREDNLPAAMLVDGASPGSIPTPGDAAGSISVGAVDWKSAALMPYSSRGPTADGRVKPDLVGPTGTLVFRRGAAQPIGGTSVSAPNVAGAAALVLAAQRRARLTPSLADLRAAILRDAVDLGAPGSDNAFGAGRVRLETAPPVMRALSRVPRAPAGGNVKIAVAAHDDTALRNWGLLVDGTFVRRTPFVAEGLTAIVRTSQYPDGRHTVMIRAADTVGNAATRSWTMVFDNHAPRLTVSPLVVAAEPPATRAKVMVTVTATDAISRDLLTRLTLVSADGREVAARRVALRTGEARAFSARVAPGRYRLRVSVRDDAGNARVVTSRIRVTGTPAPAT